MTHYIALIHRDDGVPGFGVSFPDFPGCVTVGESLGAAMRNAREALEFHMEGMAKDGDAFPAPRDLQDITLEERDDAEAVTVVSVDRAAWPSKIEKIRVNLSIDKDALARIDARAVDAGMSRSEFMTRRSLAPEAA